MVEYTDYQCPFCQRFHADTLPALKLHYIDTGKMRFFSKDLPLDFHKNAMRAALAARCAGEQNKFWELRDMMVQHAAQLDMDHIVEFGKTLDLDTLALRACVDSGKYKEQIASDVLEATKIGATGTPAFIVGKSHGDGVEGDLLLGAMPFQVFDDNLKRNLK
jgi:protein-disulfide isomerase